MTHPLRSPILLRLILLLVMMSCSMVHAQQSASIPILSVDRDTIDFGIVAIGSSRLDSFIVANTGNTNLNIDRLDVEDDPFLQFRLRESSGSVTLAPHRFIRYHIGFHPVDTGCIEKRLVIASGAGADTILLRSCVLPAGVLLRTDTLRFGVAMIDTCHRRMFSIVNPLVGSIRLFAIIPDTLHPFVRYTPFPDTGIAIEAEALFSVELGFCPDTLGGVSRTFRLMTDRGWIDLVVEGEGAVPLLDVEPDTIDFGSHALGSVVERSVVLFNRGKLPLDVKGYSFTGSVFSLAPAEASSFILGAGEQREVRLRYVPVDTGLFNGSVTVISNSIGGDSMTVLHGSAFVRYFWLDTTTADVGTSAVLHLHTYPPLHADDSITRFECTIIFDPHSLRPETPLPPPALPSDGSLTYVRSDDSTLRVEYLGDAIVGDDLLRFGFEGLSTGHPVTTVSGRITLTAADPSNIDTGIVNLLGCEVGRVGSFSRRMHIVGVERDISGNQILIRLNAPIGAEGELRVVDPMGAQHYQGATGVVMQEQQEYSIPMGGLPVGAYLVLIRMGEDRCVVPIHWGR